jgi:hypothetical protein
MTELQLGKYEFYPYPKELIDTSPTLEELIELLRRAKADGEKDVKTPSRSVDRRQPRGTPRSK